MIDYSNIVVNRTLKTKSIPEVTVAVLRDGVSVTTVPEKYKRMYEALRDSYRRWSNQRSIGYHRIYRITIDRIVLLLASIKFQYGQ